MATPDTQIAGIALDQPVDLSSRKVQEELSSSALLAFFRLTDLWNLRDQDARGLEPFHEAAVSQAECASCRIDAKLPEHAEIAFARLAVTGGPSLGLVHRVLRIAEQLGTTSAVTAGFIDDFLAALPAGGGIGGSCHFFVKPGFPGLLVSSASCSFCG